MKGAFIIFGIQLPWIQPVAVELSGDHKVVGISLSALTLPTRTNTSHFRDAADTTVYQRWVYPPGYNGTFRRVFTTVIHRRLARLIEQLHAEVGRHPTLVVPDHRIAPYLRDILPTHIVYWNYDDYRVPDGMGRLVRDPDELTMVRASGTILCSSSVQAHRFVDDFPDRVDCIHHFPHGTHPGFLNPDPLVPPESDTVCVTGRLSMRYDWRMIHDVVRALPSILFRFVGDIVPGPGPDGSRSWEETMKVVLGEPNVHRISGLRHNETAVHYWTTAANWMPYRTDLEFVLSSCPLKLTDGLASGRPVISTDVPECRLHDPWVTIADTSEEAIRVIREQVAVPVGTRGARAQAQVEYARLNSWKKRAEVIEGLSGASSG